MSFLTVEGTARLNGEISVQGAKNSALPLLAATLICGGECILHNCPRLSDVDAAVSILGHLGCETKRSGGDLSVNAQKVSCDDIPDELMREMRSSIVFLGAVLSRCQKASVSYPGGCELGPRPIDIHLDSLRKLGAVINEEHGRLECTCPNGLNGGEISLPLASVGATENIILASATASGTTVIRNAAREPEISDLADFLNSAGAKIQGAGESTVIITGVRKLSGTEHTVIPDRIAAATYMAAAAATKGKIKLNDVIPAHLRPVFPVFEEAGCDISVNERSVVLTAPTRPHRIRTIRTLVFPGFPTDAQPPVMAMCAVADGTSVFVENIFENRYKHVCELTRLGAKIKVEGRVAVVEGVSRLTGAPVEATDLRGGAALCVAALAAHGKSVISGIHHIERGYENIAENFRSLSANITLTD